MWKRQLRKFNILKYIYCWCRIFFIKLINALVQFFKNIAVLFPSVIITKVKIITCNLHVNVTILRVNIYFICYIYNIAKAIFQCVYFLSVQVYIFMSVFWILRSLLQDIINLNRIFSFLIFIYFHSKLTESNN